MLLSKRAIPLLLLLLGSLAQAERVFDELIFTKEKCDELGVGSEFEACAILEFCTGGNNRRELSEGEDDDFVDDDDTLAGTNESSKAASSSTAAVATIDDVNDDGMEDDNDDGALGVNQSRVVVDTETVGKTFAMEVKEAEKEAMVQLTKPDVTMSEMEGSISANTAVSAVGADPTSAPPTHGDDNGPNARYGYRVAGSSKCTYPGPIMRLKRGVHHGLFLKGGKEETNLHLHGLHVKGYSNGDSIYRSVVGSENMLVYDINLAADQHMGGTHWYHSHLHGKAWDQVQGGAFGMIIIDDNGHSVGTEDANVLEFLAPSSQYERIVIVDDSKKANTYTANGFDKEVFEFTENQWYRLRILTVGVDSHTSEITLAFQDDNDACKIHALAHDGIFRFHVPKQESQSEYPLTTSSRLDVAIQCASSRTPITITANQHQIGEIRVDSSSSSKAEGTPFENGTDSWNSARLEYTKDLTSETAESTMKLRVDETNINGVSQGSHKPLCKKDTGLDFKYGTIEEWKFSGVNTHPFHMHIHPMQIMTDGCGPNHDKGEYYDSILAPESSLSHPCIVRIYFIDIHGPTTVHCHIFEHAQHGAITWLNVVKEDADLMAESSTVTSCQGQCTEPTEAPRLCGDRRSLLRAS